MTRLLLGNIKADTSDDEIREFLGKYGFSAFDEIEHTLGTASRPAVMLTFQGANHSAASCSSASTTYTGRIEN